VAVASRAEKTRSKGQKSIPHGYEGNDSTLCGKYTNLYSLNVVAAVKKT